MSSELPSLPSEITSENKVYVGVYENYASAAIWWRAMQGHPFVIARGYRFQLEPAIENADPADQIKNILLHHTSSRWFIVTNMPGSAVWEAANYDRRAVRNG